MGTLQLIESLIDSELMTIKRTYYKATRARVDTLISRLRGFNPARLPGGTNNLMDGVTVTFGGGYVFVNSDQLMITIPISAERFTTPDVVMHPVLLRGAA